MKNVCINLFTVFLSICLFVSCKDEVLENSNDVIVNFSSEEITGELVGNEYVLSWPDASGKKMQITIYADEEKILTTTVEGNSYTYSEIEKDVNYKFIFSLTDGTNFSEEVVKEFIWRSVNQIQGLKAEQIEDNEGYSIVVSWDEPADISAISLVATNGVRNISEELDGTVDSFIIENVELDDVWDISLTAKNEYGESPATSTSLKVGIIAVAYLSEYPTENDLLSNGDDDEASAWLWLKKEYSNAKYLYFGDITSSEQLDSYKVLFWLRDLEGVNEDAVWNMPQVAVDATQYIQEWYRAGGNLLLWSHAVPYITNLGRIDADLLKSNDRVIATGAGGWNGDPWSMAVQLNPGGKFKIDFSSHPIYQGLDIVETDRTKLIAFKGPGWTEDHNCLFYNIPSVWTGLGNQDEECYNQLIENYGIYPLGVWDSQIDWISQFNVWEARQGNTDFKGTVLCIGNGGCEFSMKNSDGTSDISSYPKNNIYQYNVLKLAKNCIEYLKTR